MQIAQSCLKICRVEFRQYTDKKSRPFIEHRNDFSEPGVPKLSQVLTNVYLRT